MGQYVSRSWGLIEVEPGWLGVQVSVGNVTRTLLLDSLRADLRLSRDPCVLTPNAAWNASWTVEAGEGEASEGQTRRTDCYWPSRYSQWCPWGQGNLCPDRGGPMLSELCSSRERTGAPTLGYTVPQPYCLGHRCVLATESHFEGFESVVWRDANAAKTPPLPSATTPVKLVQTLEENGRPPLYLPQKVDGFVGLAENGCRDTPLPWRKPCEPGADDCLRYLQFSYPHRRFNLLATSFLLTRAQPQEGSGGGPRLSSTSSRMESIAGGSALVWGTSTRSTGEWMGSGQWLGFLNNFRVNDVDILAPTSRRWAFGVSLSEECLRLPPFLLYRFLRQIRQHLDAVPGPSDSDAFVKANEEYLPPLPLDMWDVPRNPNITLPLLKPTISTPIHTDTPTYTPTDTPTHTPQVTGPKFTGFGSEEGWEDEVISFRISEEANAPQLRIKLSSLVKADRRTLCVTPARESRAAAAEREFVDVKTPLIIFGQLALKDFDSVIWDTQNLTLAFQQAPSYTPPTTLSRSLSLAFSEGSQKCGPGQQWQASEAVCVDLSCDAFLGVISFRQLLHLGALRLRTPALGESGGSAPGPSDYPPCVVSPSALLRSGVLLAALSALTFGLKIFRHELTIKSVKIASLNAS